MILYLFWLRIGFARDHDVDVMFFNISKVEMNYKDLRFFLILPIIKLLFLAGKSLSRVVWFKWLLLK